MVAASLMICAACSNSSGVKSAPPVSYEGAPAGLTAPCIVHDVPLVFAGDILTSRNLYKEGFEKCAAKVDAIRKHDAEARRALNIVPRAD